MRPPLPPVTSTTPGGAHPAPVCTVASISALAGTDSAPVLPEDELTVTEGKMDGLNKAASGNAEPFWPGLFAKALASVYIRSLACNVGAGGPAPAAGAAPQEVCPLCHCLPPTLPAC